MKAGFFTILAVVTAACSQLPTQNRNVGGDIITRGAADYAVFAEDGAAVAIRLGYRPIKEDMAPALNAIKRATGCDVLPGSVTFDVKSVSANLMCRTYTKPTLAPKPHL
jgi:hypothetical protein